MCSITVFAHNPHIDERIAKASMLKTSNELFTPSNIMGSMPPIQEEEDKEEEEEENEDAYFTQFIDLL